MRLFHIRFSRRKLRAFVVPSFLMYVFTKPPPRFSPGGGYVGVVILMRLGFTCGFAVVWDDINLQDQVEEARAELYREQARKLKIENDEAEGSK